MATHLAGVDVGTTGVRCAIFDLRGSLLGSGYREYGASYPRPGWVEQDGDDLVDRTFEACRAAVARSAVDPGSIAAVGFSTQRSVTLPVDGAGRPVRPAISWQDARTGAEVSFMAGRIGADEYQRISGLPLGTTWVMTKALWMRRNEPELFSRTARFVQVQDFVLRAFGADDFYTDLPDMGFYGLWDVGAARWSRKLLDLFEIEEEKFGRPRPAGTKVCDLPPGPAARSGFARGTAVCVGAGDQNCSVVGMGAIRPGMATVTLGTAGLAILATDRPIPGLAGMMTTNHAVSGLWEAEGLSNAAASSYRWLRDVLASPGPSAGDAYARLDEAATLAPPGSKGLLFLPYLATAGTPHWNPSARAAFIGMSFAHGRPELARSVLEGVALEVRDMMTGWIGAGLRVDALRLGGGAARSALWNRIQADVYGRPVQTLRCGESTVLGAAILGGVGAGVFGSIAEGVEAMVHEAERIEPNPARHAFYEELYAAYVEAYRGLAAGTFERLAGIQAR
jgi:xylulokinase